MGVVPPAVRKADGTSFSLYISGQAASFSQVVYVPQHLKFVTDIRFLGTLLANSDCRAPGNVILGKDGTAFAIDFDLSRPFGFYDGLSGEMSYWHRFRKLSFSISDWN